MVFKNFAKTRLSYFETSDRAGVFPFRMQKGFEFGIMAGEHKHF